MSKLKYYGGLCHARGRQIRTVVAAPNQKQAAEMTGQSVYSFRQYWSETGEKMANALQAAGAEAGAAAVWIGEEHRAGEIEIVPAGGDLFAALRRAADKIDEQRAARGML